MCAFRQARAPHFLIIGGQRCATTWLHNAISRHPAIWTPPIKELHYFDDAPSLTSRNPASKRRYWKQLKKRVRSSLYRGPYLTHWDFRYFCSLRRDDSWYQRLFSDHSKKGLITGESTPAYATLGEDIFARIRQLNPELRLIFIMREPISRSWSGVHHELRKVGIGFGERTLEQKIQRSRCEDVRSRSDYVRTINRLERVFPREQILYLFFDEVVGDPVGLLKWVMDFIAAPYVDPRELLPESVKNQRGSMSHSTPPVEFQQALAEEYWPIVDELRRRFDGPPSDWAESYERIMSRSTARASGI